MSHSRLTLRVGLAAALLGASFAGISAAPARADDSVKVQNVKEAVKYFKKYAKKAKDAQTYGGLVMQLQAEDHPLVAEAIGKELRRVKNQEYQMILAFALGEFERNPEAKAEAGEQLVESLGKKGFENDVQDNMVTALGKLQYRPAVPMLCDRIKGEADPWLLVTTVRSLGKIEDIRALPTLLELWEKNPVGYSWETGEVTVDTGAAGTADQEAAEALWKQKYGNVRKRAGRPFLLKAYVQELAGAVARITGTKEVNDATKLRAWMEANVDKLKEAGVEIPKYKGPRKKKAEE